jgi:NAD(P)-dependent dehydrogenase (short-subunit alcohol dehydrogenase family)|tara:strand:+ start:1751 stop:2323 length:573 start_codon:yes stop_codon:yes gene_type:complete
MKILITGSSKGLGKSLFNKLENIESTNKEIYNLNSDKGINKIINKIKNNNYDVFINNAHAHFAQTKLLSSVFNLWKDQNKTIVNIISRAAYPNISKGFMYASSKASLSFLSNSLKFNTNKKCKIIDINPGLLNSKLPSLSNDEMADIIIWCLNQPKHIEIGEISAWHSAPYVDVQKQKQILLNESRKNLG